MSAMQQMQMALPSPRRLFTPGVTAILILSVGGFLLSALAPGFVTEVLGVSAHGLRRGFIWQLVTYAFVHISPMNLVFNGLVILFVGSAIEREWRTASFLSLWFVVCIACGLFWVGVSLVMRNPMVGFGAAGCSYGFIGTMGLLHRGRRFFVFFATVEAQHLALILIGIAVILNIMTPINLTWVAGALVAYVYVKAHWSHTRKGLSRSRSRASRASGRFIDID